MSSAKDAPAGSLPYTAAQTRIIEAALALFAEHGIGGTSLQMIAGEIGVTKAAVYHIYNTKEEIILAVAEVVLAREAGVLPLDQAEPATCGAKATGARRLLDLANKSAGLFRAPRGLAVPVGDEKGLALTAAGHYRGSVWIERDLVYVASTARGQPAMNLITANSSGAEMTDASALNKASAVSSVAGNISDAWRSTEHMRACAY